MAECENCRDNVTCIERRYFGGSQKNCAYFVDRNKYVEVVHGRWIQCRGDLHSTGVPYFCSVCNKIHLVNSRYALITLLAHEELFSKPKYCPNCGARMMDGGNEDG